MTVSGRASLFGGRKMQEDREQHESPVGLVSSTSLEMTPHEAIASEAAVLIAVVEAEPTRPRKLANQAVETVSLNC